MRTVVTLIFCAFVTLMVGSCVQVSRLAQTCVVCRLTRVDSTCFGLTRSTYRENECSRWYTAHVEPSHVHIWERGTCMYQSNLLGMPTRVGCNPGHYPIMLLPPSTQLAVYQHFKVPLDAKKLFESLTDKKTHDDRLDEHDEDRGHLMVEALRRWELADFPGTWDGWWAKFHAAHVLEHQEWLTWLRADSNMNFPDWREKNRETAENRSALAADPGS